MGIYVNPGNSGFKEICNSRYVDKTGLIDLMNARIGGTEKLVCVSRPRRFGKSFAAKMLCAYYDSSCDSHALFDRWEIAGTEHYEDHLNRYILIELDITGFISEVERRHGTLGEVPDAIVRAIQTELIGQYPYLSAEESLSANMIRCVEREGKQFFFIIDEWDALIREAKRDEAAQSSYLNLLRGWFKNSNFTPKAVAAAYMTGILPIKKNGSQSAISDFREYSVLHPGRFAKYTGFTEGEVRSLCLEYDMPFETIRAWYDGYDIPGAGAAYNPYSVMCAMEEGECRSYWRETSAAESLKTYVNMDYEGLQETTARLIAGEKTEVSPGSFQNDLESFRSRDDVLTLLIHLGYLTFDRTEQLAWIPNEEVREEFRNMITGQDGNPKWMELISRSRYLLDRTLAGDETAVANILQEIRQEQNAPQFYNDEQALRSVIKFGYIAAIGQYMKVEEMPSGRGIADVVFIPKRYSSLPALVVELKWNKSAGGAIRQIQENQYPKAMEDFGGKVLLVGINYDEKTKRHTCRIETLSRGRG